MECRVSDQVAQSGRDGVVVEVALQCRGQVDRSAAPDAYADRRSPRCRPRARHSRPAAVAIRCPRWIFRSPSGTGFCPRAWRGTSRCRRPPAGHRPTQRARATRRYRCWCRGRRDALRGRAALPRRRSCAAPPERPPADLQPWQQHREFIAADPRQCVAFANTVLEALRRRVAARHRPSDDHRCR